MRAVVASKFAISHITLFSSLTIILSVANKTQIERQRVLGSFFAMVLEEQDRVSYLVNSFTSGIWGQHLRNQNNASAPVQGVRFYYSNPLNEITHPMDIDEHMRGLYGYICVTPKIIHIEKGVLKVSLGGMKDFLIKGKAWDANKRAYNRLTNSKVPVIFMHTGRPSTRKFGVGDRLIGLFRCTSTDPEDLSCSLEACDSDCGFITSTSTSKSIKDFEEWLESATRADQKVGQKRRRELPIYHSKGCILGDCDPVAVTGIHSKELYIRSLQCATKTICLNAFCISDMDIIEELRKASERNVNVKVRVDHRQQTRTNPVCFEDSRLHKIEVHAVVVSEDDKLLMHKKELLVDSDIDSGFVLIGSYNPTTTARGSQESVVRIDDHKISKLLQSRFAFDWNQEEHSHRSEVVIEACDQP